MALFISAMRIRRVYLCRGRTACEAIHQTIVPYTIPYATSIIFSAIDAARLQDAR